jgi:hypothetical protein
MAHWLQTYLIMAPPQILPSPAADLISHNTGGDEVLPAGADVLSHCQSCGKDDCSLTHVSASNIAGYKDILDA